MSAWLAKWGPLFGVLGGLTVVLIAGIWLTRRGPSAAVRETVVAEEPVPSLT